MKRRRRAAVFALLAAASISLSTVGETAADSYDDGCASPTTIISSSSSTALSPTAGQTILIAAGTFTGGVNAWPSGATICVAAGATFSPPWMNNTAGTLLSRGHVVMPSTAVAGGFLFENFGQADFPASFNTNGPASLINHAGGTWTMAQGFNTSSRLVNDGQATLSNGLNLNGGGVIENRAQLTVTGNTNLNGSVSNTGRLTFDGGVNVNGGARIDNACQLRITGAFNSNDQVTNSGWVALGSGTTWQNNGSFLQEPDGLTTGASMTNSGSVTGFGQFSFTGTTVTQGTFVGSSAAEPIRFHDTTPAVPGQIFDVQNGTVANVVAAPVVIDRAGDLPFGCATPPAIVADIAAVQTGPAEVAPGGSITYAIAVTNGGPEPATGVVATEQLPSGLTAVSASGGGVVGSTTVTWSVGPMAPGATVTFTVTGTAPASGTLVAVVSATASSDDPDPSDNDGSAPSAIVTTTVVSVVPPNSPPVVGDLSITAVAGTTVGGAVPMSDPDADQVVTAVVGTPPAHGTVFMLPDGVFLFEPLGGFTGVDSFVVDGCDNGSPVLCDSGTVTLTYDPLPGDDEAMTSDGVPVTIAVTLNDIGDTGPPSVVSGPSDGTTTVEADRSITYAPTPGFVGTDTFAYEVCSEVTPSVCAQATVTIVVSAAPNRPPVIGNATVTTTAGVPVAGAVTVSDPDPGQTVSVLVAFAPSHGTATIDDSGAFTYTPSGTFTGLDGFVVVGCDDGDPVLCNGGIVTVTVAPLAVDDAATTTDGVPVTIDVAANDVGDTGPPTITSGPANGTATVEGDGSVTYAPTAGFVGTDAFDYRICSQVTPSVCAEATVTIGVGAAPNRPPVVGSTSVSTTAGVAVDGAVAVSDPDAGQTVTMTVDAGPANGTTTIDDSGAFTYTPTGAFTGRDLFTVEGCDDGTPSLCSSGSVEVVVRPGAVDDAATTTAGVPIDVDLTANDVGDVAAPTIVSGPANGSATISAAGILRYVPNAGFTGIDSVTYEVCSPNADDVCATAVLAITVHRCRTVGDATGHGVGDPPRDRITARRARRPGHAGHPRERGLGQRLDRLSARAALTQRRQRKNPGWSGPGFRRKAIFGEAVDPDGAPLLVGILAKVPRPVQRQWPAGVGVGLADGSGGSAAGTA